MQEIDMQALSIQASFASHGLEGQSFEAQTPAAQICADPHSLEALHIGGVEEVQATATATMTTAAR
jgi:hypothetical protein